jgi:hypothetical protein
VRKFILDMDMSEVLLNSVASKKKRVITPAVHEMRIVKIIYSYYCEQRFMGFAVRIYWCYSSIPTYRDRPRQWRRPFSIHRLATESRSSTYAFMTSRQPRFQNLAKGYDHVRCCFDRLGYAHMQMWSSESSLNFGITVMLI